jgi:hypothetical protein
VSSAQTPHKRKRLQPALQRALLLSVLLVSTTAFVVSVFFLMNKNKTLPEPGTTTTTSLWQYGLPEYHIELPEGYEGLLPLDKDIAENDGPALTQSASNLEKAAEEPKKAIPAIVSVPKPSRVPGPKAIPYIQMVRQQSEKLTPTLIIVIDDAGYNIQQLKPFLDLPFPITIAVLPEVDHSGESALMIEKAGKELILHQPMQALGGNNTGPGSIRTDMSAEEARSIVERNLKAFPQAKGFNNHMGSAVTRDRRIMSTVLDLAKSRGIYYLDSLTTPGTATAELCEEMNIPYWERDVFLDNTGDRQSILRALDEGKSIASTRGASVLIGHVWSAELAQTLMDIYPKLIEEGYSLSTISKFMLRNIAEDDNVRPGY